MGKKFERPTTFNLFLQLAKEISCNGNLETYFQHLDDGMKRYFDHPNYKECLQLTLCSLACLGEEIRCLPSYRNDTAAYENYANNSLEVAQALVDLLPQALSVVSFLYFQICCEYSENGGGAWEKSCATEDSHHNCCCKVDKWLRDRESLSKDIMKRGFDKEVETRDNNCNAETLKKCLHNIDVYFDVPHYGFVLLSTRWSHSMLASSLMFIYAFCNSVGMSSYRNFLKYASSQEDFENLDDVCSSINENIEHILEFLCPMVGNIPCKGECCKLPAKYLIPYIIWLRDNLKHIVRSLKKMRNDACLWSKENYESGKSSGPFKYGFMFKQKTPENQKDCSGNGNVLNNVALQIALASLTTTTSTIEPDSLRDLYKILMNVKTTPITITSVIMGFLGTAGVIAAVTYALNIIGVVEAINSIFGFPELVKKYYHATIKYLSKIGRFFRAHEEDISQE